MSAARSEIPEYAYKASDLATEFDCSVKTIHKRAKALGIGINFGGRAGYRFSADDKHKLIASLKTARTSEHADRRRKRRRASP